MGVKSILWLKILKKSILITMKTNLRRICKSSTEHIMEVKEVSQKHAHHLAKTAKLKRNQPKQRRRLMMTMMR